MSDIKKKRFNKKMLSVLIDKARGQRTVRKFSQECKISYLQLRKLILCQQENPPGDKLLMKLAENAEGGIDYEDLLFACGKGFTWDENGDTGLTQKEKFHMEKYRSLSVKQQKTVDDFIDFLDRYKSKQF